jgi:hypothetical protein
VAEQHDAPGWKLFADVFVNNMRIIDDKIPAVSLGEKYRRWIRAAMTTVVVGTHNNAALVRRACESNIAIDMFAHPVEELDDARDVSIRTPDA